MFYLCLIFLINKSPVGRSTGSYYSTVVICPAGTPMLPWDQADYADEDQEVCDGTAACGACSGGHRARRSLPRPVRQPVPVSACSALPDRTDCPAQQES